MKELPRSAGLKALEMEAHGALNLNTETFASPYASFLLQHR